MHFVAIKKVLFYMKSQQDPTVILNSIIIKLYFSTQIEMSGIDTSEVKLVKLHKFLKQDFEQILN